MLSFQDQVVCLPEAERAEVIQEANVSLVKARKKSLLKGGCQALGWGAETDMRPQGYLEQFRDGAGRGGRVQGGGCHTPVLIGSWLIDLWLLVWHSYR